MNTSAAVAQRPNERLKLPAVRVSLLKAFELRMNGRVIRLPLSAQRLLAFIALHERPLERTYVAGQIWMDSSQENAYASLRTTLWRLRRPGCPLVEVGRSSLMLANHVVVDVRELESRIARVLDRRPEGDDVATLRRAGDLLPQWYDDWLVVERERIRQLRLHALETLCLQLTQEGDFARATDAGMATVATEPLRESAHRLLIQAHLAQGNLCEALRQFELYKALMRRELGMEPSPSMRALIAPLRAAGPGSDLSGPPEVV